MCRCRRCRRQRWRCSSPRRRRRLLLYPKKVHSGVQGALMASVAGLSLTHTVGKAMWAGLFTSGKPFLRTPKCANQALFARHCARCGRRRPCSCSACPPCCLSCFTTAALEDPAAMLWMVMLAVQCLPYAATVVTAVLSARSNGHDQSQRARTAGRTRAAERRPVTSFPGLRMFFGSSVRFSARIRSTSAGLL